MNTTKQTPSEICQTLGLSLQCSPPSGGVDGESWPHIAYAVTLTRNGKAVWSGPYRLGIGHVKPFKAYDLKNRTLAMRCQFSPSEESMCNMWAIKPHANFAEKALQASVAAKLSVAQKVTPKLEDVMHSLLMDGSAHFDSQAFEDWCACFGYDTDSRKAESTFRECEAIGKALARAFSRDELDSLHEAFQDY